MEIPSRGVATPVKRKRRSSGKGGRSNPLSLQKWIQTSVLGEETLEVKCAKGNCGNNSAIRTMKMVTSDTLILCLKSQNRIDTNDVLEISNSLSLGKQNAKFELLSLIFHTGNTSTSHYKTLMKNQKNL
jgi:hypothetical protein